MPPNLIDQGESFSALPINLLQLSSICICGSQHMHDAKCCQLISSLFHLSLSRKQLWQQEASFTLIRMGQPKNEGERDEVPTSFLIWGQSLYLLSKLAQACFVATLVHFPSLNQGTQQAHSPPDQRYLRRGEFVL